MFGKDVCVSKTNWPVVFHALMIKELSKMGGVLETFIVDVEKSGMDVDVVFRGSDVAASRGKCVKVIGSGWCFGWSRLIPP